MSAESADAHEPQERSVLVREMLRVLRALDDLDPAELGKLLNSRALPDDTRRAVEALAFLQVAELRNSVHRDGQALAPDIAFNSQDLAVEIKHAGAARKVSVSMPEDLTAVVQGRVGRGKFSQYVTEAVARHLEQDLLAELAELLAAEHGPVPGEALAEARAAWPDDE
jgi:Arc/MetJ-type ribon-helix-helix transcriptional regulator